MRGRWTRRASALAKAQTDARAFPAPSRDTIPEPSRALSATAIASPLALCQAQQPMSTSSNSPPDGFPPPLGPRSPSDGRPDEPSSANASSDMDQAVDSAAEEVRTLLGSRRSDKTAKSRKRLLWGFYAYSIASEVSRAVLPVSVELPHIPAPDARAQDLHMTHKLTRSSLRRCS